MIFKCKECGCEYKTKPDFCECGNDSFDEVYETTPKEKEPLKIGFNKENMLSWVIFWICVLMSILVLAFFPKITEKSEKTENTTKQQTKIVRETNPNIPDIDTFWKNTPQPQEVQTPVEQIKELFNPKPAPVVKKPAQTQSKPKTTSKPQTTTTKPKTTSNPKPTTQQTKTQQTTQPSQQQTNTAASNPYEFITYRNALGNRLLANLNISEISGNGKCCVSFGIDSTGKLINRTFVLKSDNKSLNDEVYKMLMRTPRYNPPPGAYNGQTIKFTVELNNNTLRASFN